MSRRRAINNKSINNKIKLRYIQIVLTKKRSTGNYIQIADWDFVDLNNNRYTYPSSATITSSISESNSGESATKLLDGNTSTKYCSTAISSTQIINLVFTIDLGAGNYIDPAVYSRYRWYTANDAIDRDPISWELYGSIDGTTYHLLDVQVNIDITTTRLALAGTWNLEYDTNTIMLLLHGEDYTDSSTLNNVLTNYGSTIDSSGKFNNCFSFALTGSQYINIPYSPLLRLGNCATIDFWMYRSATPYSNALISIFGNPIRSGTFSIGYQISLINSTIQLNYGNGSAECTMGLMSGIPTDSTWHHYAITKNGNVFKIYYDGILQATATLAYTLVNGTTDFMIGKSRNETYSLNAKIDELRVSNIVAWTENFIPPTSAYK